MWWLISCVNLTGPHSVQIFAQKPDETLTRLTFKSVDLRKPALVALIKPLPDQKTNVHHCVEHLAPPNSSCWKAIPPSFCVLIKPTPGHEASSYPYTSVEQMPLAVFTTYGQAVTPDTSSGFWAQHTALPNYRFQTTVLPGQRKQPASLPDKR